jgi:hypothetical protein
MSTTPNYNWPLIENTDFVTNLPADLETLADAIDDTVKDLNPGTTAGDLDYYTSSTAKARLGIGTAGQVLKVNSGATAPEWGSASAAFSGVSLYKSGNQSFSSGAGTNVTFDLELFDTDAFHDTSTNTDRITIPAGKDGYYLLQARFIFAAANTGQRIGMIRKNAGATQLARFTMNNQGATADAAATFGTVVNLSAGDYVVLECFQDGTGARDIIGGGEQYTIFSAIHLGA